MGVDGQEYKLSNTVIVVITYSRIVSPRSNLINTNWMLQIVECDRNVLTVTGSITSPLIPSTN